jgi:hypothetical protein
MSPVGPAPIKRHLAPKGILILSIPCMAQLAGSSRVASSSVRLWILKHLAKLLQSQLLSLSYERWTVDRLQTLTKRRIERILQA